MTPGLVRPIPNVSLPGSAGAFLAVLTSQIGYREGSNNDNIFGKEYGMNNAAWCAQFITFGRNHSGCEKLIPKFAFTEAGAQWFIDRGQWIEDENNAKPGDIGFIWDRSMVSHERPRGIHHVFAVQKRDGDSIITVEGNTNNNGSSQGIGVFALKRSGPRIRGYGRPKFVEAPVLVKSIMQIAKEVIIGKWGDGDARVEALHKAGYDPNVIQTIVNELVRHGNG